MWSSAAATNLLKLQAVQNFAARIICGSRKFDHVTPLLKELHWLPIKSQLSFRDAVLAFKCMTGSAPTYLSSKFLTRGEVSGRATRNSQLLHIPLYKSKSGQRTFFYRTVSLWNSLDNSLKLCDSPRNFKRIPNYLLLSYLFGLSFISRLFYCILLYFCIFLDNCH